MSTILHIRKIARDNQKPPSGAFLGEPPRKTSDFSDFSDDDLTAKLPKEIKLYEAGAPVRDVPQ